MRKIGMGIMWRAWILLFAGVLCLCTGCSKSRMPEKKNSIRIGVSLYRGDDTFINNIRAELEKRPRNMNRNLVLR